MATKSTTTTTNTNGENSMNTYLQQLLNASQNRDAAIERIASSLQSFQTETARKFDVSEHDTRKQIESFGDKIANQIQGLTNRFESALGTRDAKLESISQEFLKSRQAPWAQLMTLGMLLLAFGGSIGWLAYNPISERTTKIEQNIDKLTDNALLMRDFVSSNFVSQRDLEARTDRGREDRERTNRAIEAIQNNVFPKEVHQTRWLGFENQFASLNLRLDSINQSLQREIDVIQKSLGDTYTARDALLDNRKRIEDLEDRIREISGTNINRSGGGLP